MHPLSQLQLTSGPLPLLLLSSPLPFLNGCEREAVYVHTIDHSTACHIMLLFLLFNNNTWNGGYPISRPQLRIFVRSSARLCRIASTGQGVTGSNTGAGAPPNPPNRGSLDSQPQRERSQQCRNIDMLLLFCVFSIFSRFYPDCYAACGTYRNQLTWMSLAATSSRDTALPRAAPFSSWTLTCVGSRETVSFVAAHSRGHAACV